MKSILILMLFFIANGSCGSYGQRSDMAFNLVYTAKTRGASIEFFIDNDSISAITTGYGGLNGKRALKSDDQKKLVALIHSVEVENIHILSPPSHENTLDRALTAKVQIAINGTKYESSTFDHGNPPMELKPLINKILALIETVE